MRRYLVRHEHQTLPFVVAEDAVYAADFPRADARKPYSWNQLSASPAMAQIEIEGRSHTVHYTILDNVVFLELDGFFYRLPYTNLRKAKDDNSAALIIRAEIPGRIVKVLTKPGDTVTQNQPLIVQEAMKMELTLRSPGNLVVAGVAVAEGAQVEAEAILVTFETPDSAKRG